MSPPPPPRADGFTLLEVLVAVVLLEVGLVGCAGTLTLAHRALSSAERIHGATQSAADLADSLLTAGFAADGVMDAGWGRLRWSGAPGGVRVRAEDPGGGSLFEWWVPGVAAEGAAP